MKNLLQRLIDRWEAVWDVKRLAQSDPAAARPARDGRRPHARGLLRAGFPRSDVRSHEAPPAEPETNRSRAVWFYLSLLLAVGAGLAGGAGVSALYAAFGALILGYTPLLTYIGVVLRSEEHRSEDLSSGDGG